MPKGFAGIREAVAANSARRGSGSGGGGKFVLPKTGDSAQVRFLEQGDDVHYCWAHKHRQMNGRLVWVVCLDQDDTGAVECPGCKFMDEEKFKRQFRIYINLIWRDAPTFKKEGNEWVESGERADRVVRWEQGVKTGEKLDEIDATYKGLMSRDFIVRRKGDTWQNTEYSITPADPDGGPQEMSEADIQLAEQRQDLNEFVTPLSLSETEKALNITVSENGGGSKSNLFLKDD